MRSLSPSRILVCTSTVSPIEKFGTSDLRLDASTSSRICWLMVIPFCICIAQPRRNEDSKVVDRIYKINGNQDSCLKPVDPVNPVQKMPSRYSIETNRPIAYPHRPRRANRPDVGVFV